MRVAPQVIPVELAIAALLTELKAVAERGLDGTRVVDCVLSVPPMFTHVQRAALLDAARLAGLNGKLPAGVRDDVSC